MGAQGSASRAVERFGAGVVIRSYIVPDMDRLEQ